MSWEDLVEIADLLFHSFFDVFYSLQYILSNILEIFKIIITPLTFAFNFVKGFFDGIATPPPEEIIDWTFSTEIWGVLETIPYFTIFIASIGAGLGMLFLAYLLNKLTFKVPPR